jgi:predicted acylesterase/phospholipase RssA
MQLQGRSVMLWRDTREEESMVNSAHVAPDDRFCDLVMKGGITSGVVYPPAIMALAEQYRFKNIGGTSAGAIAAAVTAAAEFRRRRSGSTAGFELLGKLPTDLGTPDSRGDSQLLRLFQPDRSCRRLFRVLVGSLNAKGTFHRIGLILWGCVTSYWLATTVTIILSVLVGTFLDAAHAGFVVFGIGLPTVLGLFIYLDVTRNVVANNYGLCKGMTTRPKSGDALTPWLHKLIQNAADLPLNEPLTFGHLWNADKTSSASAKGTIGPRSIDLKMFTTNLSHGRPYIFPHAEPTARLFYKPAELMPYLPDEVMQWLNDKARDYQPNAISIASDPKIERARELNIKEIPLPEHFPILLAARMSLSFPILFSAVPMWAIDYEYPRPDRDFRRCVFSDGGISSNFPMHLFDALLPQWPTFGINLEAKLPGHENMIFLPRKYLEGIADRWTRFDQERQAATRMGGFLMSIVSAMQNWNDNMLSRMPGVRDRVVRVRLTEDEGGMNLNMPRTAIDDVAKRGWDGAQELIARFLGSAPADGWDGWSTQRWIRLDVIVSALSRKIADVQRALGSSVPHSRSYADLITHAEANAPPGHAAPLTAQQTQALTQLSAALESMALAFAATVPNYPNEPLPEPELRVRPPL